MMVAFLYHIFPHVIFSKLSRTLKITRAPKLQLPPSTTKSTSKETTCSMRDLVTGWPDQSYTYCVWAAYTQVRGRGLWWWGSSYEMIGFELHMSWQRWWKIRSRDEHVRAADDTSTLEVWSRDWAEGIPMISSSFFEKQQIVYECFYVNCRILSWRYFVKFLLNKCRWVITSRFCVCVCVCVWERERERKLHTPEW